jgi:Tol biopolymer transport system component/DNA-binding winged helix-turn-helix (wHTH) protein
MAATGRQVDRREPYRFNGFELDLHRQALFKGGIRLKLQRQPFQVLALLVEAAPNVVSRNEIRRYVWGDEVHIDADQSINFCIRQIRSALSDTSADPRFVETVPREGYRFIGTLESHPDNQELDADTRTLPTIEEASAAIELTETTRLGRKRTPVISRRVWVSACVVFLVAGSFAGMHFRRHKPIQVRRVRSFTTDPGFARDAEASPDGTAVAFSWRRDDGTDHIYIQPDGRQQPSDLTNSDFNDRFPAWSPDGRDIAFVRFDAPNDSEIRMVSPSAGKEVHLRRVKLGANIWSSGNVLAWTTDGEWVCFTDQMSNGLNRLFLLSRRTGQVKALQPEAPTEDESSPAFAPDGRSVAYVRFLGLVNTQLVIQRIDKSQQTVGEPIVIAKTLRNPSCPVWLKDGTLLFLDEGTIMRTSFEDPKATPVYAAESDFQGLTYDALHSRLITSKRLSESGIWTLPLTENKAAGEPKRVVRSTTWEEHPAYSPDGKWLTFGSGRTGSSELWLADSEGRNPRQLTHLSAYIIGYPHWSPDSKFITFHARVEKTPEVYVVRLEDSNLQKVTDGDPGFILPSFSNDGKSIFCTQFSHGNFALFRLNLRQSTREPLWHGFSAMEAPGRNSLLYMKSGEAGIYERSLSREPTEKAETLLIPERVPFEGFFPTAEGIFYSSPAISGWQQELRFYSYRERRSSTVARLGPSPSLILSVKPDRSSVIYDGSAVVDSQLVAVELN